MKSTKSGNGYVLSRDQIYLQTDSFNFIRLFVIIFYFSKLW